MLPIHQQRIDWGMALAWLGLGGVMAAAFVLEVLEEVRRVVRVVMTWGAVPEM